MVTRKLRFIAWWRRSGIGLRIAAFLAASLFFLLLIYLQKSGQRAGEASDNFGSNLLVFSLVNFNIIVLIVLAFLVGRNVVKLIFDRRRGILGSQLRLRLVLAFVLLSLVPTILLFVSASGLIQNAVEGWFNTQLDVTVSKAREIGKIHLDSLKQHISHTAERVVHEVTNEVGSTQKSKEMLRLFDERRRSDDKLFAIDLVEKKQQAETIVSSVNALNQIENFKAPPLEDVAIDRAIEGSRSINTEAFGPSRFVRVYEPLELENKHYALILTSRLDPELTDALSAISDSYTEYQQLKVFKNPLRSSYLLMLSLVTGLILFGAIWFGFYLARELSGPIQRLAQATESVARGNYDVQLRVSGEDEMSHLMRSFNRMTMDLKVSRAEAAQQRRSLEAVLAHLATAVIAVDTARRVTSINHAAAELFSISRNTAHRTVEELPLEAVIDAATYQSLLPLVEEAESLELDTHESREMQLTVAHEGQQRRIVATVGRLSDERGRWSGTLLVFDDITELAQAQSMAAWREVARRIAHEIKNPLTPIQLSAQRLEKLLSTAPDNAAVKESTRTIVEHVSSIKRLADEFSRFARLPTTELSKSDLNSLISELIAGYAERLPTMTFQVISDPDLPLVFMDREQIRRALINLIDNAVSALAASNSTEGAPRISVKIIYSARTQSVQIEVIDNGPGIPLVDRERIFEPYFTTRSEGTGLGLAIVNTIVSDHGGSIRLYNNQPHGARFVLQFPIAPRNLTQRRLSESGESAA